MNDASQSEHEHQKWEQEEMPAQFSSMMNEIRSQPMPEDSLERSLRAAEAIVMTKAAYKRGSQNVALAAVISHSLIGFAAYAICQIFQVDLWLSLGCVFAMVCTAMNFAFGVTMFRGYANRGEVLIDCGPHPARKQYHALLTIMFLGALAFAVGYRETAGVAIAISLLVTSSFFWIASKGRLQICENGVFQYFGLLPWSRIGSYRWEGTTDATLMIQSNSTMAILTRGAFPVAVEQKEAVEAIMQEHLGGHQERLGGHHQV